MVPLYRPIFKTGLAKEILESIVLLRKIVRGQNLTTGPKCYLETENILEVESF